MHASGTQAKISINISDVIFHHELEHGAITKSFLPPANEVWGKVIFLEACVKNSVYRGGSASVHAGIPPPGTTQAPPSSGTRQAPLPLGPGRHPFPWDQAGTPQDQAGTLLGLGRHSPRTRHPRDQQAGTPLPPVDVEQSMLGNTVNERAVCILLECNLVYNI